MSVWFGWPDNDETFNIKASDVNLNLNTGNIFNDSITTTFKNSNFVNNTPISTFRDTATFTINPFDEKHAVSGIWLESFGEEADDHADFQKELVEKLNDKKFQSAARQRYKIFSDNDKIMSMEESAKLFRELCEDTPLRRQIYEGEHVDDDDNKIMSKEESAKYFRSFPELTGRKEKADDSILQCDSAELPTRRAGKTIKELTQEVQYDLERERDVKRREELIMRCARYMRLERMSQSLNDLM